MKTTEQHDRQTGQTACPVVGIGASAGGLEAFRRLLSPLKADLGMAYVFVQHLDPTHQSLLPSLLTHMTAMPVQEVTDGMTVQPNTVYVVPAGAEISLDGSCFSLRPFSQQEGQRAAIDHFFTSLAASLQDRAIGVVLSGTASDGVRGLQAIKANGGTTFAQDEQSASFPQMPHNAVATGCVDAVLPPETIAETLNRLNRNIHEISSPPGAEQPGAEQSFTKVLQLLRKAYGVDFFGYKPNTLLRRIQQRMVMLSLETLASYATYMGTHEAELEMLFQRVLIPTTSFFRDPEVYTTLTQRVFPELVAQLQEGHPIRMWIPACSTGEEAYSLLISLLDAISEHALPCPLQVFATDLNPKAVAFARTGIYQTSQLQSVSAQRLARFFVPVDAMRERYQIAPHVREYCVFATHNLLEDPPFSHLNLVSCRNLLIYLKAHVQQQVLQTLHYALKPQGILLLGTAESVEPFSRLFQQVAPYQKLYRTKTVSGSLPHIEAQERVEKPVGQKGVTEMSDEAHEEVDLQHIADRFLLTNYVPASVVIDAEMEILYIRGHTSPYLEPAQGKVSFNLLRMLRPGLVLGVKAAVMAVRSSHQRVTKEGLQLSVGGKTSLVRLSVVPLTASGEPPYFLVIFEETLPTPPSAGQASSRGTKRWGRAAAAQEMHIATLEQELAATRAEMARMLEEQHAVLEEHHAVLEELQTVNEETRSQNEELQTLNEELETSKEELQVINEELTTANEELHVRSRQLLAVGEYEEAIVETVREPLLVLSQDLRVERANAAFYVNFQVTPQETEGRYLYEVGDGRWNIPRLRFLLEQVLLTNQSFQEFEVEHLFPLIGHKTLLLNARRVVQLHLPQQNHLILLAIEDITERRALEQKEVLLGMVSHELKTPLTSALLYTELLEGIFEREGNAQTTSHFRKLIEQLDHLSHYIKDLVDATAVEAGTLHLQPAPFAMDELVQQSVEMLRRAHPHTHLLIEGMAHAQVFADRERTRQVLINLLTNAVKYGGSSSPIYVRIEVAESLVTVSVQDHGTGIPVEQQGRIFERFYRGADTTQGGVPGLGLGLYLAAKLVKQQGGEIWVESRNGVGTTFSFTLPQGSAT